MIMTTKSVKRKGMETRTHRHGTVLTWSLHHSEVWKYESFDQN